jgi:hypothetical protein
MKNNKKVTLQGQLADELLKLYPTADVKKIDDGNYLDIHMPDIHPKRGTHIWFNTPKAGGIKVGFFCRDKDFIEDATNRNPSGLETYANGLRLSGHPTYNDVSDAITAADEFVKMLKEKTEIEPTYQKSKIVGFQDDSVVHNITYLFCALAHITDEDLSEEEMAVIAVNSLHWLEILEVDLTEDGVTDKDDINKLLYDDVIPYYNDLGRDQTQGLLLSKVQESINFIKELEWWDDECSKYFLANMKEISEADGEISENEKGFINICAEELGFDSPV